MENEKKKVKLESCVADLLPLSENQKPNIVIVLDVIDDDWEFYLRRSSDCYEGAIILSFESSVQALKVSCTFDKLKTPLLTLVRLEKYSEDMQYVYDLRDEHVEKVIERLKEKIEYTEPEESHKKPFLIDVLPLSKKENTKVHEIFIYKNTYKVIASLCTSTEDDYENTLLFEEGSEENCLSLINLMKKSPEFEKYQIYFSNNLGFVDEMKPWVCELKKDKINDAFKKIKEMIGI